MKKSIESARGEPFDFAQDKFHEVKSNPFESMKNCFLFRSNTFDFGYRLRSSRRQGYARQAVRAALIILFIACLSSNCFSLFKPSHAFHHYLFGMFNHFQNKPRTAEQCFDIVFKHNGPAVAYQGFMHHLHKTQQHQKLITFMPALEKELTADSDVLYLYAQALEVEGRPLEATTILTNLAQENLNNAEIVYSAVMTNARNGNPEKAIELVDNYLKTHPHQRVFIFHFIKGQILANNGRKEEAIKALHQSVAANPRFDQGWMLLGMLHQQNGMFEEAIKAYKKCLDCGGNNPVLERQIVQLQLQHQSVLGKNSSEQFKAALKLFDDGNYKEALALAEKALRIEQSSNMRLLKLEILCRLGSVDEALQELQTYLSFDPTNVLWFKALNLIYKAGAAPNKVVGFIRKAQKEHPLNLLAQLYAADIFFKESLDDEAVSALQNCLGITNDPTIRTKCYFKLARYYHAIKNKGSMMNALYAGYELQENYLPLLNMLAYHSAKKENKLEFAQKLISAALDKEPKNHTYLDTQAIIWYKQNKLKEAASLLTELAQSHQNDPKINKHLSKILFKQGTISDAVTKLKTTLQLWPTQEKKEKYRKRIEEWNKLA